MTRKTKGRRVSKHLPSDYCIFYELHPANETVTHCPFHSVTLARPFSVLLWPASMCTITINDNGDEVDDDDDDDDDGCDDNEGGDCG